MLFIFNGLLCFSVDVMDKATSRFRIGLMFGVMGLAILGSIAAIVSGKKERAEHIKTWSQAKKNN